MNRNSELAQLPRMRTIPQAHKMILEKDPETCISIRDIRRLVATGDLPTVKTGNKILINFDLLMQKLSCYNNEVVCVS